MSEPVRLLFQCLLALTVLLMAGLFAFRLSREARERGAEVRAGSARRLILTGLLGEPDEAAAARTELRGLSAGDWAVVEEQGFAMAPKIKGAARDDLVTLLLSRGAAVRATANARSRSHVRRARGAHQLGVLGQRDGVGTLLGLLVDPRFLVRRLAVRALGQVGDPLAVHPLLDAADRDPELVRDVTVALAAIGAPAAGQLRRELRQDGGRRTAVAARVLGLVGDVRAVPLLVDLLERRDAGGLRATAAGVLGEIGAPEAVVPLLRALTVPDQALQVAAGRALGAIGAADAVPGLESRLDEGPGHDPARAVAGALRRIGGAGVAVLERSGSPYAAEALALHRARQEA